MNEYTVTPAGLICSNCGARVPNGEYHTCGTQPSTTNFIGFSTDIYTRIAIALERIANALENRR